MNHRTSKTADNCPKNPLKGKVCRKSIFLILKDLISVKVTLVALLDKTLASHKMIFINLKNRDLRHTFSFKGFFGQIYNFRTIGCEAGRR